MKNGKDRIGKVEYPPCGLVAGWNPNWVPRIPVDLPELKRAILEREAGRIRKWRIGPKLRRKDFGTEEINND